jgi:hypothetical protein
MAFPLSQACQVRRRSLAWLPLLKNHPRFSRGVMGLDKGSAAALSVR